ncbi:hypothetical protein, partial [Plasmodium yoelii yoelii]
HIALFEWYEKCKINNGQIIILYF